MQFRPAWPHLAEGPVTVEDPWSSNFKSSHLRDSSGRPADQPCSTQQGGSWERQPAGKRQQQGLLETGLAAVAQHSYQAHMPAAAAAVDGHARTEGAANTQQQPQWQQQQRQQAGVASAGQAATGAITAGGPLVGSSRQPIQLDSNRLRQLQLWQQEIDKLKLLQQQNELQQQQEDQGARRSRRERKPRKWLAEPEAAAEEAGAEEGADGRGDGSWDDVVDQLGQRRGSRPAGALPPASRQGAAGSMQQLQGDAMLLMLLADGKDKRSKAKLKIRARQPSPYCKPAEPQPGFRTQGLHQQQKQQVGRQGGASAAATAAAAVAAKHLCDIASSSDSSGWQGCTVQPSQRQAGLSMADSEMQGPQSLQPWQCSAGEPPAAAGQEAGGRQQPHASWGARLSTTGPATHVLPAALPAGFAGYNKAAGKAAAGLAANQLSGDGLVSPARVGLCVGGETGQLPPASATASRGSHAEGSAGSPAAADRPAAEAGARSSAAVGAGAARPGAKKLGKAARQAAKLAMIGGMLTGILMPPMAPVPGLPALVPGSMPLVMSQWPPLLPGLCQGGGHDLKRKPGEQQQQQQSKRHRSEQQSQHRKGNAGEQQQDDPQEGKDRAPKVHGSAPSDVQHQMAISAAPGAPLALFGLPPPALWLHLQQQQQKKQKQQKERGKSKAQLKASLPLPVAVLQQHMGLMPAAPNCLLPALHPLGLGPSGWTAPGPAASLQPPIQ